MTFDLLIRNGTVVDGTGAAKFSGDVGITAGRITDIGTIPATATAKQVIDAQDKIVCPGFIDPHTHYDPQITWDSVLSSSSEHGITTIVSRQKKSMESSVVERIQRLPTCRRAYALSRARRGAGAGAGSLTPAREGAHA